MEKQVKVVVWTTTAASAVEIAKNSTDRKLSLLEELTFEEAGAKDAGERKGHEPSKEEVGPQQAKGAQK